MAYVGQGSDERDSSGATTASTTTNASGNGLTPGVADGFSDYHFSAFVAMETLVTVVPRFSMDRVECLGGTYGPFATNYPVEVPLWLALHLRQTESCTLTPPPYLRLDYLQAVLDREQASEGSFEPIPFYLFEVAKLFVDQGNEDVPQVAEVVRVLGDLKATRQRKLQLSMGVFEAEGSPMFIPGIKLTNLVSSELHMLRHSFAVVLEQASAMDRRRYRGTANMPPIPSHIAATATTAMMPAAAHQRRTSSGDVMRHGAASVTTTSDASLTLTPSTRLLSTTSLTTTPARLSSRGEGLGAAAAEAGSAAGTQHAMLSDTPRPANEEEYGMTAVDVNTVVTSLSSQQTQLVHDSLTMSPSPSEAAGAAATLPLAPPAKRRRTLRQT